MKKWIVIIVIIIVVIIGYNYVYQDHRDISSENPEFVLAARTIAEEFANEPIKSEEKYLNKTIVILGNVSESTVKDATLDSKVFCQFKDSLQSPLTLDSSIKIKGRIIGYDDLLEQVKLDQCTLIQN